MSLSKLISNALANAQDTDAKPKTEPVKPVAKVRLPKVSGNLSLAVPISFILEYKQRIKGSEPVYNSLSGRYIAKKMAMNIENDVPMRAGLPYSINEDVLVRYMYEAGYTLDDIAKETCRSKGAIESKLSVKKTVANTSTGKKRKSAYTKPTIDWDNIPNQI